MAQIGTIKVETAGGPVELPVYDLGDSGSDRVEAFRVQTASGPGFVPLTDVSEADRPYLRVQTGNGVKAFDTNASVSGIPDSAVHRYKIDEGSGTVIEDSIGGADGDINGTTWVSDSAWQGGAALDGNGSDNYENIGAPPDFYSEFGSNWSIGLTFSTTSDEDEDLMGVATDQDIFAQFQVQGSSYDGKIDFALSEGSDQQIEIRTENSFNDGLKKRVVFVRGGETASDLNIYVNDTDVPTTIEFDDPFTGLPFGSEREWYIHAAHLYIFGSSNGEFNPSDAIIDDVIFYNTALSANDVSSDYEAQPWTP